MPCRDYYDDNPAAYYEGTIKGLKSQVSFAESALCAFMRYMETQGEAGKYYVDNLDYVGSGITQKELEKWWTKHKKLDEEAREKERAKKKAAADKKKEEKRVNDILAKLSPDEVRVLKANKGKI